MTDLTHWRYELDPHQVGVDPVLGRIAFPVRDVPEEGVHVSYRRLTVGGLGGGQYHRSLSPAATAHYLVRSAGDGAYRGVGEAFAAWRRDRASGQAGAQATIEIADDGVYSERLHFELRPGETLEIRSADGHRAVLIPEVEDTDRPEPLRVTGLRDETALPGRRARPRRGPGGVRRPAADPPDSMAAEAAPDSTAAADAPAGPESPAPRAPAGPPPDVTFDGIWIARHPVLLAGHLGTVTFRHCTLVPSAVSRRANAPVSLLIEAMPCAVCIEFSVAGRIRAVSPETGFDPVPLAVTDSILDAGGHGGTAIEGAEGRPAWVRLSLGRVTVLGGLDIREVGEVSDSIVTGRMDSARRQVGRVRFCYLPEDSRTPRRSSCQPDGVLAEVDDAVARGLIPADKREEMRRREAARVTPRFDSVRFGAPAYGRLAGTAAAELTRGAHDEGELGGYHEWWLAYRAAQLRPPGRLRADRDGHRRGLRYLGETMYGDFSRMTFSPAKNFTAVWSQQGRVQLDADANEQTAILLHWLRTLAIDFIGPFGGHVTRSGFAVQVAGSDLTFSPGHYYVYGLRCDLPQPEGSGAPPVTYSSLVRGADPLPSPPFVVQLFVWERSVSAVADPELLEAGPRPQSPRHHPALPGGLDSAAQHGLSEPGSGRDADRECERGRPHSRVRVQLLRGIQLRPAPAPAAGRARRAGLRDQRVDDRPGHVGLPGRGEPAVPGRSARRRDGGWQPRADLQVVAGQWRGRVPHHGHR